MASFVPYYGKKREQLAKHESELIKLLKTNATREKVRMSAEKVRAAHISAIRSKLSKLTASPNYDETLSTQYTAQIAVWSATPLETIIQNYSQKLNP